MSRDVLVSEQTATGLPALPLLANVRYGVPCEYPVSTRYSTRYSTPLVPLGTVEAARVSRSTRVPLYYPTVSSPLRSTPVSTRSVPL